MKNQDSTMTQKKNKEKTAIDVKAALENKYCAPAFAFFTEVANGTGMNISRYADAVAFSLYPSAGLEMIGFEIKVSRADFLSEMKNPQKSNDIMKYCDRWWLVCPKGLVDKNEIPRTWGLLELTDGGKFHKKKEAPLLEAVDLDRNIVAALLRRGSEGTVPKSVYNKKIENERRKIKEQFENDRNSEPFWLKKHDELQERIDHFEEESGLRINSYTNPREVGKLVRKIMNNRLNYDVVRIISQVESISESAKELKKTLDDCEKTLAHP